MFENLKQHINRENLHAIKKKNRYLQEQNDSDQEQQDLGHFKSLKSKHSGIQKPLKSKVPFFETEKKSGSQSQDSLSDYELQQRQQVFVKLTSQPQIQFSPVEKQKLTFANTYFTPESKIKELQRSVELSQEKLRLASEYHSRELSTMSEKHERIVRELSLEVEKLKLIIEKGNQKDVRASEIVKENAKLRETLVMYEEKYWKFQQVEKINTRLQTENKVLKLQNTKLRDLIGQIQSTHQSKASQVEAQKLSKNPQLQQLGHKLGQSLKTIANLEKKLSDCHHQQELDQLFYQQKTKSLQRKIEELQESLKQKQRQLTECQVTCDRLKTEKEMVEKSLLHTMESFSKHLSNQSISQQHNLALMTQINRSVSSSGNKADQRSSPINQRKGASYNEPTINLDEQEETVFPNYKENDEKNRELSEVSPVPVKKVTFYEPQIAHFDLPANKERTRIMSYHTSGTSIKPSKVKQVYVSMRRNEYDPEKSEENRVAKLERKLEQANMKIVELLREKLSRAAQPNTSLLLR